MLTLRLLFIGLAVAAGATFADRVSPPSGLALGAGVAGILALAAVWYIHAGSYSPGWGDLLPRVTAPAALVVGVGMAAVGFSSVGLRLAAMDRAFLPAFDGTLVEVKGRAVSDSVRRDHSTALIVRTGTVEGRPTSEKVAVTVYGRQKPVELGSAVDFQGKIKRLESADEFDKRLRRKQVVAKATVSGQLNVTGPEDGAVLAAANHFRDRFSRGAVAALGPDRSALLLGLVIGDDREVPSRVSDDFRAAGLSHLTAVSGANLAMVLGPVIALMTAFGAKRRTRVIFGIAVIAMFVVVTRWEPSVLRAALMASAALAAFLFGRRSNALHLLLAAFIILVAFDPFILWSLGFQLSFAATAGILALSGHLLALFMRLRQSIGGKAERTSLRSRMQDGSLAALAVGLAAQAAVAPVAAVYFGKISLVAVPANLAAVPLVPPATILGFAGGLAGLAWNGLAAPFYKLAGLFVAALEWVARTFGGSAAAQLSVPNWKSSEMLAAYLALAACGLWLAGYKRVARWPLLTAGIAMVLALLAPAAVTAPAAGMTATFFDVGQGDAALVESGAGARVLIDGGPDPALVAARLARKGIERIDVLILSHAHEDHVAGLRRVLERMEVKAVFEPGVPDPWIQAVLRGKPASKAVEGEHVTVGGLYLDFLGPGPEQVERAKDQAKKEPSGEGSALNDASVVVKIGVKNGCALFTGDIEEEGQSRLLHQHGNELRCQILKAPHHGSARLLPEFVSAVRPRFVTVSSGPNKFGHPTRKALSIFESAAARTLRTDRSEDVVLDMDGQGRTSLRQWKP